ncbi:hypothetical protein LCGC14_0517060 [marine sediment metagenome]|uniref:Uncharacterized protein n=1 Tax=marine sediment metagenome TaxID=412755 RepID=A0A0F9SI28_9ZZZZ
MGKLIQFKRRQSPSSGHPLTNNATKWQIWRGRARGSFGRLLCLIKFPGFVEDIDINDSVTGQQLTVSSSPYFTRISVNGRDYYFDRLTGKFDGTGMGCSS